MKNIKRMMIKLKSVYLILSILVVFLPASSSGQLDFLIKEVVNDFEYELEEPQISHIKIYNNFIWAKSKNNISQDTIFLDYENGRLIKLRTQENKGCPISRVYNVDYLGRITESEFNAFCRGKKTKTKNIYTYFRDSIKIEYNNGDKDWKMIKSQVLYYDSHSNLAKIKTVDSEKNVRTQIYQYTDDELRLSKVIQFRGPNPERVVLDSFVYERSLDTLISRKYINNEIHEITKEVTEGDTIMTSKLSNLYLRTYIDGIRQPRKVSSYSISQNLIYPDSLVYKTEYFKNSTLTRTVHKRDYLNGYLDIIDISHKSESCDETIKRTKISSVLDINKNVVEIKHDVDGWLQYTTIYEITYIEKLNKKR